MKKFIVVLLALTIILVSCKDLNDLKTEGTKYSVFYHGNGNTSGSTPIDNTLYLSGENAIVKDKGSLQKDGFEFAHWNTKQQGNGETYNSGTIINIKNENINLYAIWKNLLNYTVTFETYGGSSVQKLENVIVGSKINRPTNPTKVNSLFEGWFTDEEFENEWDFQKDIVEGNLILYAKWRSTLYQHEVTNIYHIKISFYMVIYWTNPTDDNFSHVRIIPAGFEWADSSALDQEPGITSYSAMDFANTEYVIIKSIGKNGNVSEGIKYYLTDKANPVVEDFNINGLGTFLFDGLAKTVTITPKVESSQGTITVYYNGSTTAPSATGTYTVTFDVAAATGFNAVTGLTAGILTINPTNQTPSAVDFNISGLGTYRYDGTKKTVTITPKAGSSQGAITVYYNGSTADPSAVGTYTVTFDVEATTGFNAVTGLSAGVITINAINPVASDFNISGLGTYHYDGTKKTVTITPKAGSSQGAITVYYNGSITDPIKEGKYTITFDVSETTGFNAVTGLSGGTLTINSPYTVTFNSNGGSNVASILRVIHGNNIIEPINPTKTGFVFDNWYKEASLTNIWNFSSDTVTTNITLYAKWDFKYALGDTGPGEGKIFYRSETGFIMTDTGERGYYLEAAPSDMSSTLEWASQDINKQITMSYGIGGGRSNTALILSSVSNAPAARACNEYSSGGKNDWYLPNINELRQLYNNKNIVGNLNGYIYWSSWQSTDGSNSPMLLNFYNGLEATNAAYITYSVRAIRAF